MRLAITVNTPSHVWLAGMDSTQKFDKLLKSSAVRFYFARKSSITFSESSSVFRFRAVMLSLPAPIAALVARASPTDRRRRRRRLARQHPKRPVWFELSEAHLGTIEPDSIALMLSF